MNITTPTCTVRACIGQIKVTRNYGRHAPAIAFRSIDVWTEKREEWWGIMTMPYRDQNAVRWAVRRIQRVLGRYADTLCPEYKMAVVEKDGGWVLYVDDRMGTMAGECYGILLAEMRRCRNPIRRGYKRDQRRRERANPAHHSYRSGEYYVE